MTSAVAFGVGVLFALGLGVSHMTDPQKILAFLNVLGDWDPTLLFVMAGAVGSYALVFAWIGRRGSTLFGEPLRLPARRDVDGRLVVGSILFGLGWGMAGFCPGPLLVSLVSGVTGVLIFAGAMLAGMAVIDLGLPRRG